MGALTTAQVVDLLTQSRGLATFGPTIPHGVAERCLGPAGREGCDALEGTAHLLCPHKFCSLFGWKGAKYRLNMLEKQMAYCAAHGKYELGLACGTCALRYDVAHERVHRRLMRLCYLAGDRTAALRQYERCVTLLQEELGVDASARTVALHQQIRSGRLMGHSQAIASNDGRTSQEVPPTLDETLHHLSQLQTTVAEVEHRVQEVLQTVEPALNGHK
jgi:hypothetical protein